MTVSSYPSTIALSRGLHQRLLDGIVRLLRAVMSASRARAERRRASRGLQSLTELDEVMLRDIGAPPWMVADAAARRDAHEMRLFELQFARDVDRLHGLK